MLQSDMAVKDLLRLFGAPTLRQFRGLENCARFELKFSRVINSQSDVVA
jgi:hypothetical protein